MAHWHDEVIDLADGTVRAEIAHDGHDLRIDGWSSLVPGHRNTIRALEELRRRFGGGIHAHGCGVPACLPNPRSTTGKRRTSIAAWAPSGCTPAAAARRDTVQAEIYRAAYVLADAVLNGREARAAAERLADALHQGYADHYLDGRG